MRRYRTPLPTLVPCPSAERTWRLSVKQAVDHTFEAVGKTIDAIPSGLPFASSSNLGWLQLSGSPVGQRFGLASFEFDVLRELGQGKSGVTYLVEFCTPASAAGARAVLKVQSAKAVESIDREAAIMKRAEGLPHAAQMLAFGNLWIPGHLWFRELSAQPALLMTLAPGDELARALPLDDTARRKLLADLEEFASKMKERNLLHGDLTPSNVFWDGQQTTVIDFGNGQDLKERPTRMPDFALRQMFRDAKEERQRFCDRY